MCGALLASAPIAPVWVGEMSVRCLGVAVHAFDGKGVACVGEVGELVITEPMPSMPVRFLNDPDGERLKSAYFHTFDGVWSHGDWITITERGSASISGRSDATLNRGGVRIGTAEVYRVVEAIDGIAGSLVVHLEDENGGNGDLILFVVETGEPRSVDDAQIIRELRVRLSPRHAVDEIHRLSTIPTTLSGKKLEIPVKKVLQGLPVDSVASRASLRHPEAFDEVVAVSTARKKSDA